MAQRVESVDFWRGLILVAIFINHVPGNPLEALTHNSYGWSDAAEAFVFLSGLSVFLAWGRHADAPRTLAARCGARAWSLYRTHLLLSLVALCVGAAAFAATGIAELRDLHGREFFFAQPASGALGLATTAYQLGYFNILPLYVVVMLASPLIVAGAARAPVLTLAGSAAVYAAARLWDVHPPGVEGAGWHFNPLAWQILFVIGAVAGAVWRDGPPRSPALTAIAATVVIAALLHRTNLFGAVPGVERWGWAWLDGHKPSQGLARLLHFLALAYLLAIFDSARPLIATRVGQGLRAMGRVSLPVFCVGSALAAVGQVLVAWARETGDAPESLVGAAWVLFGIAVLVVTPRLSAAWDAFSSRASSSSPSRPAPRPIAAATPRP